MSFFNDFFESVKLDDIKKEVCCNITFGKRISISGNFKIDTMSESEVILKINKVYYKILGNELSIISISKGEIEVGGDILGVLKL